MTLISLLSTVEFFQIDSSHGGLVVTLEMSVPCLVTNGSVLHTLAVEKLGANTRNTFVLLMGDILFQSITILKSHHCTADARYRVIHKKTVI